MKQLFLIIIIFFTSINLVPWKTTLEEATGQLRAKELAYYKLQLENIFLKNEDIQERKEYANKDYQVAIFKDVGVLTSQSWAFANCINEWDDIHYTYINAEDIIRGKLSEFDVLIIPGGNASLEANTLTIMGRIKIVEFVRSGGGYLGVCAGAYLSLAGANWAMPLLNADVVSYNWFRGGHDVEVEITDFGKQIFGDLDKIVLGYNNGPIVKEFNSIYLPKYEVLAYLRTGYGVNKSEAELMNNSPAIIYGVNGNGKVIMMNVHPEKKDRYHFFVREIIYWLAKDHNYELHSFYQ